MNAPAWKSWSLPATGATADLDEWQDGRCAWCGTERWGLVRDHCHMTGLVRGLLCSGCNTREGVTASSAWDGWRSGDNPANAIGHFEIYANHLGATPTSPRSALQYYSDEEQLAWFAIVVAKLRAGEMSWPTDAPWLDTAIARRDAARSRMQHVVLPGWSDGAA